MVGGGFVEGGQLRRAHLYEYRITGYFAFACIIAALGGSLFGYDLGVSGEVTSMDDFLKEFFPKVNRRKQEHLNETNYYKLTICQREMVESCRRWTVRSSPKRPVYQVAWMIPG